MLSPEEIKKNAGMLAADWVRSGMTIGLGTGTTVYWLIQELGKRIRDGLQVTAVPTSLQTAALAGAAGIALTNLDAVEKLVLAIDGADEIDSNGWMIKGGGGALLQEKIVAAAADELLIIVDHSKQVDVLGKFPLPVEVIPFGHRQVRSRILSMNEASSVVLREKDGKPFVTDHGHYILDCSYGRIDDIRSLNSALHLIPGVVETGLFIGMAAHALVGREDGTVGLVHF
jgi:ribose 5-phosphate isomerase A